MIKQKNKFSKDPKTKLISIKEFFEETDYLCNITENNLWDDKKKPELDKTYYKLSSTMLVIIRYGFSSTNFGMDIKEKLESIEVALRDGETDYKLIDEYIISLKEEKAKHRKSKKLDQKISFLESVNQFLPIYKEKQSTLSKSYDSYLIDTGYKTNNDKLKEKYLVFDIETNGLRNSNDDLLSLSIYDPTTGICYNRFFPLDLQPLVLTSFIHGITDKTLANENHMTQDEMDWLIKYFHIKDRTLLSFSGGKGTFDLIFVQNYCKRHHIAGFEEIKTENIKNKIPRAPFGTKGQLTKDNLCRMFKIEGVKDIHSSFNDCILEWKLFEKLESDCMFFIGEHLYKFRPEYIIPVSYLTKHPELVKYANVKVPYLKGTAKEIYSLKFSKKLLKKIKKFPTNITGIAIEHGINVLLKAEEQNNFSFLAKNKSYLEYVGSLNSMIHEIPIITENDGTVKAIKEEDKEYIKNVNETTKLIVEYIKPLAEYIKSNIFTGNKIMTQELSISSDKKVLALCDLSDSKNVIEIKTNSILETAREIKSSIAEQLYYQANGRKPYALSIVFDTHENPRTFDIIVDALTVHLYKIKLSEYNPEDMVKIHKLTN
jgi:hypothetical protein